LLYYFVFSSHYTMFSFLFRFRRDNHSAWYICRRHNWFFQAFFSSLFTEASGVGEWKDWPAVRDFASLFRYLGLVGTSGLLWLSIAFVILLLLCCNLALERERERGKGTPEHFRFNPSLLYCYSRHWGTETIMIRQSVCIRISRMGESLRHYTALYPLKRFFPRVSIWIKKRFEFKNLPCAIEFRYFDPEFPSGRPSLTHFCDDRNNNFEKIALKKKKFTIIKKINKMKSPTRQLLASSMSNSLESARNYMYCQLILYTHAHGY
jgi:hypothetical protein